MLLTSTTASLCLLATRPTRSPFGISIMNEAYCHTRAIPDPCHLDSFTTALHYLGKDTCLVGVYFCLSVLAQCCGVGGLHLSSASLLACVLLKVSRHLYIPPAARSALLPVLFSYFMKFMASSLILFSAAHLNPSSHPSLPQPLLLIEQPTLWRWQQLLPVLLSAAATQEWPFL